MEWLTLPLPLRYRWEEDTYSVYLTATGQQIALEHGTGRRLFTLAEVDLDKRWREFTERPDARHPVNGMWDTVLFMQELKDSLTDPDDLFDEVYTCDDCHVPDWIEESYWTGDEDRVCADCLDRDYTRCNGCDEHTRWTTTTLSGSVVCETCREAHYWYCDYCDGVVHENDGGHYHDDDEAPDCDCAPVGVSFKVRNDGEEPLANDTRAIVALPAGVISDEGIAEIRRALQSYGYTIAGEQFTDPEERDNYVISERDKVFRLGWAIKEALGNQWQTKRGNYSKRLQRHAYNEFQLKLPPALISEVGNIARAHSREVAHQIEVTRELNGTPYEFCHEESCWWTDYNAARCALKSNGGFGLRTFIEGDYGDRVNGRAWVMPLKQVDGRLTPTFETLEPDALMVFNGYGDLEDYTPARIVSHMAGMTYRKIEFTCEPMYVNNSTGYLVAPEEIASKYTDGALNLNVPQHASLFEQEKETAHV